MKATRRIVFVLACLVLIAGVPAQAKPNVLFCLTDDLGYGDVGCYGAEGQDTPAIDQLAKSSKKCQEPDLVAEEIGTDSRIWFLTPFCLRIDEVAIFNYGLDKETIQQLDETED